MGLLSVKEITVEIWKLMQAHIAQQTFTKNDLSHVFCIRYRLNIHKAVTNAV